MINHIIDYQNKIQYLINTIKNYYYLEFCLKIKVFKKNKRKNNILKTILF